MPYWKNQNRVSKRWVGGQGLCQKHCPLLIFWFEQNSLNFGKFVKMVTYFYDYVKSELSFSSTSNNEKRYKKNKYKLFITDHVVPAVSDTSGVEPGPERSTSGGKRQSRATSHSVSPQRQVLISQS